MRKVGLKNMIVTGHTAVKKKRSETMIKEIVQMDVTTEWKGE